MVEPSPGPPPIFGVTVEQYAGVNAAMLEGFGLTEVLASEGLDEAMWPRAAVGWSTRIARAGAEGALSLTYRAKLAFAQEWLGRRIEPLCGDLAAWFGFLGAFSAHPAPFDLLKDLGLQSTAPPAPLPTPPASGWAPLSCATVLIVAMLVCAYLFLSTVPSCFIG